MNPITTFIEYTFVDQNYRDTDHFNQTDLKFTMPAFLQKQLRKIVATIDPFAAHQINQQVCHAFLKRHQLKGLKISNMWSPLLINIITITVFMQIKRMI